MSSKIADIKKIIYASLNKQTLGRALAQLSLLVKGRSYEPLQSVQSTYQLLLESWYQDLKDPEQEHIFQQLLCKTYEITDDLCAELVAKPASTHPLFSTYWEPNRFSDELVAQAKDLKANGSEIDTCLAVSAITLNCIQLFDEAKFLCLIDFCHCPHKKAALRALTGVMICLFMYRNRYQFYPSINSQLPILFDDSEVVTNAQHIVRQLIRSKETERITQDIKENVMPKISKLAPQIQKDLMSHSSDHPKDFDTDDFEESQHDWQDLLDDNGISDKMEAYAKLQREGSDINLSTFSQMKGYPFFQDLENWFMPFYEQHPLLTDLGSFDKPFFSILTGTTFLCDSDKYSFCLNLLLIPKEYRDSMFEQLKLGDEQVQNSTETSDESITNLYLQDLYRFYKLYKGKNDFFDIFTLDFDIHQTPFFRFLAIDEHFLPEMAEYFFAKEQYENALSAYIKCESQFPANVDLFRKIGYCYQKNNLFEKALEYYQKADLIDSNQLWTCRKMAYCYRMLNKFDQALQQYLLIDAATPNDLHVIYHIGACYTELGDYEKALNAFYKIEFLQENKTQGANFHLYMGHCLWMTGDRKKAIAHYALYPHEQISDALQKACIPLNEKDWIYIVDYLRYHSKA